MATYTVAEITGMLAARHIHTERITASMTLLTVLGKHNYAHAMLLLLHFAFGIAKRNV